MGVFPTISGIPQVQAHYERCRAEGTSHSLAEMFALGQTPFLMTDSVFMEGRCNGNQFEKHPEQGDFYAAEAKAQGVDITGKFYSSFLAEYPGDPRAWVSGRGDVKKICEERNLDCRGAVSHKATELPPPPGPPGGIAPELVDEEVRSILDDVPEKKLPYVDTVELREQVIDKRKAHWAK
jgi:hypothetical protein